MHEEHRENSPMVRHVCVLDDMGLHARPAARLAKEAQRFQSDIRLAAGGQEVDAKSILDILTLSAAGGSALELRAHGSDAPQALDHLESLFRNHFEAQDGG
nr:HPr family phosphocarrier protein [Desulfohalovibrio reitneri]